MSNLTFSGPLDAIKAGLSTSGNDAVYFNATAPNPQFDPEDYYTIRGEKKYWTKPTVSVAYLTIDLKGDTYSVGKAWTHESYRRQGIIRRLYDMAWDYARSKGKGFQAGWVQSPLMAKYWESLVDQGKAEAYTDEWTRYNTTGKGWRRIRATNLRPPCNPFEHGYAFIEPSGKVHLLNMSHPNWAENYLFDHPELGDWDEQIGGLLKHGWIRVTNITNLNVLALNTPPKAAWAAVLDLMVDCVRKDMDPNVIIYVDHEEGDSNRTSKWRAGDFARKFGGQVYEDAIFDAAMSRAATKKASLGEHKLPKLPYAYDALEPHISEETLRFHYDKHHKAYVDGLNDAERAIAAARKAGDFEAIPALNAAQAFNAGGHFLHTLYWESLTPERKDPSESLVAAIERDFGSWDAFRSQMKESTVKVRGSGWGVLVLTPAGLRVLTVMNHENGVLWDGGTLLPIDAWEHAYYLDYQNDRAAHFDAVFDNLVNWSVVEGRLKDVRKVRRVASRYAGALNLAHYGLDDLARGGSATLYHGTTRSFQRFDRAHIRHDLINRFYKAPGIFLAPRKSVATEYAWAARNALIHESIVDDLIRKNRGAGEVLKRFVQEGQDAWNNLFAEATEQFPDEGTSFEALERMAGGVDPNTLMDMSQHIEGSRYVDAPKEETLLDLWGGAPKGTPAYIFDIIDAVGLDSSAYRPKVYTVSVSGLERVLVTKSKAVAEKAQSRGYDAVIWHGADMVDAVPEVVVFDPSKVRVTKVEILD